MAFFDDLKKNLSEVSESVSKKSATLIETQKLKTKKHSLETECKSALEQLGKMYFVKIKEGMEVDDEVLELYDKIIANKEAVKEIEEKIIILKGVNVCPNCQADVGKDNDFCPRCGIKVEKQQAEVKEPLADDEIIVEDTVPDNDEVTVEEQSGE